VPGGPVTRITARIWSPTKHAVFMELGAPRAHVAPRPHLRPAMTLVLPTIPVILIAKVRERVAAARVRMIQ